MNIINKDARALAAFVRMNGEAPTGEDLIWILATFNNYAMRKEEI